MNHNAPRYGVLGPLTVTVDGRPIDIGGPKQKAVLALLLINANRAMSVERMIYELWPGDAPRTATATLQAYISNLRRALEPGRPARAKLSVLLNRGGAYELSVEPDHLDAFAFERLAGAGGGLVATDPAEARRLLGEALALWRGPALVEFALEEFAAAEANRLEELRVSAIENRIAADLALGRSGELIAELECLVVDHPLRERLWAHLMLAFYRSGRQAEALRAYRRCEQMLGEGLGILPSVELRELEEAILNQDDVLLGPAVRLDARAFHTSPQADPGVVGRGAEFAAFRDAVARARQGHGTLLLVEGEPGIGKTRLLEAMQRIALADGSPSGLARCVEVGGSPPFWPWSQLLRSIGPEIVVAASGEFRRYLGPLLPDRAEAPADESNQTLFHLAEAMSTTLRSLSQGAATVLLIDDLYSADPDSLALLALLGTAIEDLPVVIIGTHRGVELPPDHPLVDTLVQLQRLPWVRRLPLRRFDLNEVTELVTSITGSEVDPPVVRAVHRRTHGNAFFTVELVKLLDSEGALTADGARSVVPVSVRDVINRRLSQLSETAVRLLRAAAVAGRTFELTVAAGAAGIELDDALDAADEAVAAGLIAEFGAAGQYRFSHVLVVDAVVSGVGALRRAQLHDRLADALAHHVESDPSRWPDVAHHRVEAIPIRGRERAIEALTSAGRHALAVTALELAERLFQQRHELVVMAPPSAARDEAEVEALLDLALVRTWRNGYHSQGMQVVTERLLTLTKATTPRELAKMVEHSGEVYGVLCTLQARCSLEIVAGRVDGAAAAVDDLLKLAEIDPRPYLVAVANINAAVVSIHAGRIDDALHRIDACERLIEQVDPGESGLVMLPLGQQSLVVTHRAFAAWAKWLAADRDGARAELAKARAICDRIDHPFSTGFLVSIEAIVASMDNSPEWVADVLEWGTAGKDPGLFGLLDMWHEVHRVWSDGMLHHPAGATAAFRAALDQLDEIGARVALTMYWGHLAELELAADRPEAALDACRIGIERSARHGERFWYSELERTQAVALGRLGRLAERNEALRRAERAAHEMGVRATLQRLPVALRAS